MRVDKIWFVLFVILLIFIVSCRNEQKPEREKAETNLLKFKSEKYGFSFSYHDGWEEINRDLPDKWALLDKNKNTIIFVVNSAKTKDLLSLGRSHALRDLYNEDKISDLKQDDLQKIFELVKLDTFNNRTWYTYGVKFSDKNVNSLISGTLCGDNEIMLVLVSDFLTFDKNKEAYVKILSTFEC